MNRIKGGTTCLLLAMLGTSGGSRTGQGDAGRGRDRVGVAVGISAGTDLLVSGSEIFAGCPNSTGESLAGVWPAKRAGDQWPTGLALAASGDACDQGTVG